MTPEHIVIAGLAAGWVVGLVLLWLAYTTVDDLTNRLEAVFESRARSEVFVHQLQNRMWGYQDAYHRAMALATRLNDENKAVMNQNKELSTELREILSELDVVDDTL
jgi:hypothetical protein